MKMYSQRSRENNPVATGAAGEGGMSRLTGLAAQMRQARINLIVSLGIGLLSFVGMAWWFFAFAAGDSLAPMAIAAVAGLLALVALAARTSSGGTEDREQVLEMSALLAVVGVVGFLALSLVLPSSQGLNLGPGESPTFLLRSSTVLSFLVGAISINAAIALLLSGIWPRR